MWNETEIYICHVGNLNLCGIKALKPPLSHAGNSIEGTLEYHNQTTLSYLMLLLRRLDTAIALNPKINLSVWSVIF